MTAFERRQQSRSPIVAEYETVRDYLVREQVRKPLIHAGGDRWGDAAAVLLRLLQDGTLTAVGDGDLAMFSDHFSATGDEDTIVTFADLGLHRELRQKPATVILFQAFPAYVDAERIAPTRR